jgi:hypothetical protein
MPVLYGSPDLLPTLNVVYACGCGRRVAEAGAHAGEPPPQWVLIGDGEYLCEHCASQTPRPASPRAGEQPR